MLFARFKLARAVLHDGERYGVDTGVAVTEIPDVLAYLARAKSLHLGGGSDADLEGILLGVDAALDDAEDLDDDVCVWWDNWDEPARCILSAFDLLVAHVSNECTPLRSTLTVDLDGFIKSVDRCMFLLARAHDLLDSEAVADEILDDEEDEDEEAPGEDVSPCMESEVQP